MDIRVSIIIPVYNVAPFLEACLSSCVNQTFRDIEIIVVNDGSTDESSRIIKKYAEKDNRIIVVTKENQGLIYARKSGLDVACGEYVFHLDGDDYIEANTIEELYSEAVKCGADYIIGNCYLVSENNKLKRKSSTELNGLFGQELLLYMLHAGWWPIWGKLIRKSLFDDLVYCPVVMGEDLFLNMQICLKIKKSTVIDTCLYNYILRSDSITKQKEDINMELKFDMIKYIFLLLDIFPYNQQIRNKIYLMFLSFYLYCMSQKKMEVKAILSDYYWNKKEVKTFLYKKRKDFYLIMTIFFRYPSIAALIAKRDLQVIFLWRKITGKG